MGSWVRISLECTWWGVRNEWTATRDLRSDASLVCTAFSRHPAGLLSAGEHDRHVRVLVDRAVGSCCDALLSALPAGVAGGNLAWQGDESSHAGRNVPEVCLLWAGGHRGDVAGTGDAAVDERIKG